MAPPASGKPTLSRRHFIAGGTAAGVVLGVPSLLVGCGGTDEPRPSPTPLLGGTRLEAGWQMRRFQPGDDGALFSTPGAAFPAQAQSAVVPGTVLTSLLTAGKVLDPYVGTQSDSIPDAGSVAGGVALYTYWFMHRLALPGPLPDGGRACLVFHGINYSADVYFNRARVATGLKGMFIRHRVDVTKHVVAQGENALAVLVTPPNPAGIAEPVTRSGDGKNQPSSCQGLDGQLGQNVTAQFSGGWDFVQAVADRNTGLWDAVELKVTGPAMLETDPHIRTRITWDHPTQPTSATVLATVEVRNTSAQALDVEVRLEVDGRLGKFNLQVAAGAVGTFLPQVVLANPQLWWPHGQGTQTLYPTSIEVLAKGVQSDSYTCQTGVREITSRALNTGSNQKGRVFTVNRRPIFIRGGAWTFADAMLRLSAQNYDDQVRMHQVANFNMIRIWGGGLIERPAFYDACDRHGLLVWQEFPASADCLKTLANPADPDLFVATAEDAVRMLRNHASLALWVGQNEAWDERLRLPKAIDDRLRAAVNTLDPATPYVSWSTDASEGLGGPSNDGPYDPHEPHKFFLPIGDASTVNPNTFNPEYGSVGFPVIESLRRFMPEAYLTNPADILVTQDQYNNGKLNRTWLMHRYTTFYSVTKTYTTPDQLQLYGRPEVGGKLDIVAFCEQAQAAQHQQYKALFEGLNAGMWTVQPTAADTTVKASYTGGIIWRSQAGWTSLRGGLYDAYLEPTAALFGVRQACAAVNVQINRNTLMVEVVNNTATAWPAGRQVDVTVCDDQGQVQPALARSFTVPAVAAGTVAVVSATSLADVLADKTRLRAVRTVLSTPGTPPTVHARNFDWFGDTAQVADGSMVKGGYAPLRNLDAVVLSASGQGVQGADGRCTATLNVQNTGTTLAFFNRIRVWQTDVQALLQPVFMSDNYFSLLPLERATITLDFKLPTSALVPQIRLTGWNSGTGALQDVVAMDWREVP